MKWTNILLAALLPSALATFVPTNEWQEVPDDEMLSPGLHVRLDLATNHREAKLADVNDSTEYQGGMIVSFNETSPEKISIEPVVGESEDDGHGPHIHTSGGELQHLLKALRTREISEEQLEDLNDLAHDLKFGSAIIKDGVYDLLKVIKDDRAGKKREIAARALGAAIRNNPSSQTFLVDNQVEITSTCLDLLKHLTTTGWLCNKLKYEVLISRIIYVLGSSVTMPGGWQQFVSGKGSDVLFQVFEKADIPLKSKISNFVVDRLGQEWWSSDETEKWCDVIQKDLAASLPSSDQIDLFGNLCYLKQQVPTFTDRLDFLEWIASLHAQKGHRTGMDDLVEIASQHRHEFGNPLAGRKHHADEL